MDDTPFCMQLSVMLSMVDNALAPMLNADQRTEVEQTLTDFDRVLQTVDRHVAAVIALQLASRVMAQIVTPPPSQRIALS